MECPETPGWFIPGGLTVAAMPGYRVVNEYTPDGDMVRLLDVENEEKIAMKPPDTQAR